MDSPSEWDWDLGPTGGDRLTPGRLKLATGLDFPSVRNMPAPGPLLALVFRHSWLRPGGGDPLATPQKKKVTLLATVNEKIRC